MPPTPPPTWQRVLAQGAAGAVYLFRTLGRPFSEIYRFLAGTYGVTNPSTARAVIGRVDQAMLAGDALTSSPLGNSLADAAIPQSPLMVSIVAGQPDPHYRYHTIVEFENPTTGTTEYRTVIIDSASSLTRGDVARESLEAWLEMVQRGNQYQSIRGEALRFDYHFDVAMIFRR